MPAGETICISFGNWIVAFYVVYVMSALAFVAASAVVIDWMVNRVRMSHMSATAGVSRRAEVAGSRA